MHNSDDELDALVADVRSTLVLRSSRDANQRVGDALAASVTSWLETLLRCVGHAKESTSAEREDLAAVLALTLGTCARTACRQELRLLGESRGEDPFRCLLFQVENITMVVAFLARLVRSLADGGGGDEDEQCEVVRSASEVLFAINQLANGKDEIALLLDALRRDPVFLRSAAGDYDDLWRATTLQELTRDERLAVCFAHFVSDALADDKDSVNKRSEQREVSVLSELTDDSCDRWKQIKWERSWQLRRSSDLCHRAFGTSSDCVAMVKAILQGFSIPQIDADSVHSFDLASFLATVDLDDIFGLRHGVDVTLVRDGALHPGFAAGDVLLLDDIMDAFENKYTIGIRGVHARSHQIAAVCRSLQGEMAQHVNANIYWTPSGERGFDLHIDDHCVFVIQLKGKKNWRLKPHVGELPVLYSDLRKPDDVGPTEQVVLEPGNILYIPRGTPHCADTRGLNEDSIHLTIGVEIEAQFTKRELVKQLLVQQAHDEAHPHLRERAEAVLESKSVQNLLRGGLMSWHLASNNTLRKEAESLLCKLSHEGAATAVPDFSGESNASVMPVMNNVAAATLVSLRSALLEDRRSFLSFREGLASMFVSLHRCLELPSAERSNDDDEEQVSSSSRVHKRARLSD